MTNVVWLFLLLSSCNISMSREEILENIMSAPSLEQSEKESLEQPFFAKEGWPAKNWWEMYGSQRLNALIEEALAQNPTIQSVESRLEYARKNAIVVRRQLYPLVTFNANDQMQYLSKNGLYRLLNPSIPLGSQDIQFNLSFWYEFDFWSKYRNLYCAALGRVKAAFAETAQAELIVEAALSQTYFALVTNLVRKKLYQKLYQVRKDYFELQESLQKNALSSALPPLLFEEDVFQAQQWILNIDEEIAANRHAINILAGRGPDEPIDPDPELPALPQKLALPDNISMELLCRRPDLMAQIWRVEALSKEVGAARADFWPNVNILALIGYESFSWSNLFNWASKTIGALPGLSLPVYTAGEIAANADAKKALFDEAVYEYNALILKSFSEVADLLALGRSVYGRKEQQEKILHNAAERYSLSELRGAKGLDSAFAIYRTLEELLQKQLEDVQLLYAQYAVSVKLIQSLGGGYFDSESEFKDSFSP